MFTFENIMQIKKIHIVWGWGKCDAKTPEVYKPRENVAAKFGPIDATEHTLHKGMTKATQKTHFAVHTPHEAYVKMLKIFY